MRKQRSRCVLTDESVSYWCVTNHPTAQCLETMVTATYIICVLGGVWLASKYCFSLQDPVWAGLALDHISLPPCQSFCQIISWIYGWHFLFINHQPSQSHPNKKGINRYSPPDEAKMWVWGKMKNKGQQINSEY